MANPDIDKPFVVEPHDFQFKPGIDLNKLNQLCDELEVEAYLESLLKIERFERSNVERRT
jgi:hypothetical protein